MKKNVIIILMLTLAVFGLKAQFAVIHNAHLQIHTSLNNEPLAWATNAVEVSINKQTGEFVTRILADNLYLAKSNNNYTGLKKENQGKYLTLTGVIPVYEVDKTNSIIDLQVEITANFNDIDNASIFTFSVIAMSQGFSVQVQGKLVPSDFEMANPDGVEDELVIWLSFTGL